MWFWHVPFWCLSQILKVLLRSLHSGLSVLQRFVSSRLSESRSVASLCNPVDCSPPGSSVRGILQARILEWVVMPSSRGSSQPRDQTQASCVAGDSLLSELYLCLVFSCVSAALHQVSPHTRAVRPLAKVL